MAVPSRAKEKRHLIIVEGGLKCQTRIRSADSCMCWSKRWEAFPIDVWVRRVMNELYIHNEDETKVKKEQIFKIANEMFGPLAGIAQQYLFYWKREA